VLMVGVILLFPRTANLRHLPGPNQWYLYLGGVLGLVIVAAPVFLVPRIGATATVTAIVIGQLTMAVVADQFGLFGNPKIALTIPRLLGVLLLASGAYLVARS
ncbi:MAG TPA: DMT family transporter, partial [Spirochaetia bacterium]|nr:DMT family transporter [Spirochaetia bacterium]